MRNALTFQCPAHHLSITTTFPYFLLSQAFDKNKERCTPLRKEALAALRLWLRERKGNPADILFPSARGQPLSRDGVKYLLAKHIATACIRCPSIQEQACLPARSTSQPGHGLAPSTELTGQSSPYGWATNPSKARNRISMRILS